MLSEHCLMLPRIVRRSRNNQHCALICINTLFSIPATICFGSSLPSSGSFFDHSELPEIQIECMVYHIMCGYVGCVLECLGSVCCASQIIEEFITYKQLYFLSEVSSDTTYSNRIGKTNIYLTIINPQLPSSINLNPIAWAADCRPLLKKARIFYLSLALGGRGGSIL
jgi:hypothetical protein